ncbi:MAG: AI-2E family transporter [Bacteroides sp.]|jgi:predicted PurR-regulated permease PerM|nr:AI-2E family transporter [Bacteroides sp.]
MVRSTFRSFFWLLLFVAVMVFLSWYFLRVVIYLLVSVVLALLGKPVMDFLSSLRLGRFRLPQGVSAFITLLLMIGLLAGLFSFMLPLLTRQAALLSDISVQSITTSLQEPLLYLERHFHDWGILAPSETISERIIGELSSIVTFERFSAVFNSVLGLIVEIFIGFLAIAFITFFFLKEEHLFTKGVLLFTPKPYKNEAESILRESKILVRRYITGLVSDLALVFILISLCMWVLGLENALVIGFFAGILNTIPYVGPIIATFIGVFLGLSINLDLDFYTQMLPLILKIVASFIIVNTIDVSVLQPMIYSKSVRSHPLEIFIVFILAGIMGGVFGMIIAIPSYSVLRIFIKVFLEKSMLVRRIMEEMKL